MSRGTSPLRRLLRPLGVCLMVFSAGCSRQATQFSPNRSDVLKIEAIMQHDKCIGGLAKWKRRYFYFSKYVGGKLDFNRNIISFYYEPAADKAQRGIFIESRSANHTVLDLYEGRSSLVVGNYRIADGRISRKCAIL